MARPRSVGEQLIYGAEDRQIVNSPRISIGADFSQPELTKPSVNVFDPPVLRERSRPTAELSVDQQIAKDSATSNKRIAASNEDIVSNQNKLINSKIAVASGQLFMNVMNAQSKYQNVAETAKTNMYLAHMNAQDAISRGRQAGLQLEGQGRESGEVARLSAAAQGLDLEGGGVMAIVAGQEAVGYYNSAVAEINATREALGYEQEVVQYEAQIARAANQRDMEMFSSFLSFGASAGPLMF